MEKHVRLLESDAAFDPETQAVVGCMSAGLDDQLRRLKAAVEDLPPEALAWQSAPGMNSIGMLLAHLALVEVWWFVVCPTGAQSYLEGEDRYRELLGIEGADDGIPLAADGAPPEALRGKSAAEYVALLDAARAGVHEVLHTWTDVSLGELHETRRQRVTRRWILYHVLEHFAAHHGQILLMRHQLADAGLTTRHDG